MRQITIALLSAIFVALVVVAFELARIDRELAIFGDVRSAITVAATRPPETRAQRNLRLQHEEQETFEDMQAILATPDKPKTKRPAPAPAGR